ncbi:glycosyltransferase [Varibaculum timonense]|uniref:glycosyltransferase n=1 Tax=Varibaculum timonense TaxID=1964383 RepID=UPI0022E5CFEC|nr:glycosyltransferase [Varibaculum timonense]
MAIASASFDNYQPPSVQVFLVTRGLTPYLQQSLNALQRSRYPLDSIVVVDTDPATALSPADLRPYAPLQYTQVKAKNLGQAVSAARADNLAAVDYLWLLHDDSAPDPACLGELVQAFENSTTLGIAGPKALDWDKPDTLASVGIHATRSGKRLSLFDSGELDQGQYDSISDVLTVGSAGMLIKAQLWDRLRASSPLLSPFTEALELGRRARMAGYRVCLVPSARIYHAQAGLYGLREYLENQNSTERIFNKEVENPTGDTTKKSPPAKEPAATQTAPSLDTDAPIPHQPVYVYDPPPITPLAVQTPRDKEKSWAIRRADNYIYRTLTINSLLLPLWILFLPLKSTILALCYLLRSEGYRARAEINSANQVLKTLGRIVSARRIQRRQSQISRRELARLEVPPSQVRQNRRLIRKVRQEHGKAIYALGALAKSQLESITKRARIIAWSLAVFFLFISLFAFRDYLGGMHGGFWSVLPGNWNDFFALATSYWRTFSTGMSGPADPIAYPLLVFSAPFALFGISPTTVLRWLLILSPLAAVMSAWLASAALTRINPLRALFALSWAGALPFLVSLQSGNLPAALSHICLPLGIWGSLSFLGLCRPYQLSGVYGTEVYYPPIRPRAAGGVAALALSVVCAAAPWMWPLAFGFMLLCVVSVSLKRHLSWRKRFSFLCGALVILGPSLATLLPSLVWALRTHSLGSYLFITPAAVAPISMREQLFSLGQLLYGIPVIAGIAALGGVVLAATAALFTGRDLIATRVAWAFVLAGMVIGAWAAGQMVAPGQRAWLLSVFSLLLVGLLGAAVTGINGTELGKTLRYLLGSLLALALVLPLVTVTTWSIPNTNSPLKPGGERAPVAFSILSTSEKRTRMLLVDRQEQTYQVSMRREEGPGLLATNWQMRADIKTRLAPEQQVLTMLVAGNDQQVAKLCADLAIEQLLVTNRAGSEGLNAKLAASSYFHPVSAKSDYQVWRLDTSKFSPPRLASRVRIEDIGGQETVPAGVLRAQKNISASSRPRKLLLAEATHPDWKASVDGRPLLSDTEGELQVFTIPANISGHLEVSYGSSGHNLAITAVLLVYLVTIAACLPLGERRERE